MNKFSTIIQSTEGIHAKIAVAIVNTASKYPVDIVLNYDGKVVDVKSILGLMSLAVPAGHHVELIAYGDRAEEAVTSVIEAIK